MHKVIKVCGYNIRTSLFFKELVFPAYSVTGRGLQVGDKGIKDCVGHVPV